MQPLGTTLGGFDSQRLKPVSLEEFAGLLGALGLLPDLRTGRYDEQRQVIAAAFFGFQDVVAEGKPIGARLTSKAKSMQGTRGARLEQMNGVAIALRFEELPDGFRFHEAGGFGLHLLDVVEKLQRLSIALGQQLFEIALESEMAAVKHEGIDIAPHFGQIWNVADAAV